MFITMKLEDTKKKSIQHLENFLINILSYFLSAFPMPV